MTGTVHLDRGTVEVKISLCLVVNFFPFYALSYMSSLSKFGAYKNWSGSISHKIAQEEKFSCQRWIGIASVQTSAQDGESCATSCAKEADTRRRTMLSSEDLLWGRTVMEGLFLGPAGWLGNLKSRRRNYVISFEFKMKFFRRLFSLTLLQFIRMVHDWIAQILCRLKIS